MMKMNFRRLFGKNRKSNVNEPDDIAGEVKPDKPDKPAAGKRKLMPKIRIIVRNLIILAMLCGLLGAVAVMSVSAAMVSAVSDRVISAADAALLEDVDCVLVLGAGVRDDGSPSDMLRDRVSVAITLYQDGVSDRLLMSGDHGRQDYDEVNVMKRLATEAGIDGDAVFCDHAGFSTYESIYRALEIFCCDRIVIVTQQYHLYRALYIAEKLGIEAYGVNADLYTYSGQEARDLRETVARFKDFFYALLKPLPTYLGDVIPISGKGSATDG